MHTCSRYNICSMYADKLVITATQGQAMNCTSSSKILTEKLVELERNSEDFSLLNLPSPLAHIMVTGEYLYL